MERIPEKVTVRLDFTTRERLAHWMAKWPNRPISKAMRSALREWLTRESEKDLSDSQGSPSGPIGMSDNGRPTARPGEESLIRQLRGENARLQRMADQLVKAQELTFEYQHILEEIARQVGHTPLDETLIATVCNKLKKPTKQKAKGA